MKYDRKLFELSQEVYSKSKNTTDKEVKQKQKELLKIFLKRFKQELINNEENDLLKVRFQSEFWCEPDEGYDLINELVGSEYWKDNVNNFDNFFKNYFIYLGDMNRRSDEFNPSYFEIIWDYKSYYEIIKDARKVLTLK